MVRLLRILTAFVLLTAMAGAVGVWIGIPYLEHRWTYFPEKSAHAERWHMPADAEEVAFFTSDGVRLVGWFFGGKAPRNGIAVLHFHGNEGVLPDYLTEVQILQGFGFDVLMFNYRGFDKSAGTTLGEATLHVDSAAALRYLTQERGMDPHAVALLGISLGAAVAADLAASSPCRAVALVAGFTSAKQQAARMGTWSSRRWLPDFLLDLLSSPLDTVGKIGKANCPVAIVQGEKDEFVPFEQASALYRAARPPKQLIIVPGAAHGMPVSPGPDGRRYLRELASFFIEGR